MPPQQTRLGDDGIAEELAESQRAISIAEFFEKNKHMLGFDSGARGLVTAVKEGVDNALDACEEADILPDIYVEIEDQRDYYRVVIEDNGPGITREQIPKIFGKLLYGSRFHKREQSLPPDQRVLVRRDGAVEFVPIGVLCDAYLPEDGPATRPIPTGVEVPSFDREDHEVTWQPVTHAIRHETTEPTFEITTENGRTVEVTGNHSLFSLTPEGETREVKASNLVPGDAVLAPQSLPGFETPTTEVNLLHHLDAGDLADRRLYVYGFDRETLADIETGERVRKRSTPDDRERTYYRYDGVDIPRDCPDDGYLPAEAVVELGWEDEAARQNCRVGGPETTVPVSVPVDEDLMRVLGHYIAEGDVEPDQVGFVSAPRGDEPVQTGRALAGGETTVGPERTSTGVETPGSPLAAFLENACGDRAGEKRVPAFAFQAPPPAQRHLLAALYEGAGARPGDELSHVTTSERLARQVAALWNAQGVVASVETDETGGCGDGTTHHRTTVSGADVETLPGFQTETESDPRGYRQIPTALLDEVRVDSTEHATVPDSVPGLLVGAGVGSTLDDAAVYRSLVKDALDGEEVQSPRYASRLRELGLFDADHRPTERLEALWETVQQLQGFTDSDMCLLPVEGVVETEPPEYVYDISVPGATGHDENFVVANDGPLAVKNSRGQQGIGISAAVLYAQLTSGKPAEITSRTRGSDTAEYFELIVDTDENEPEISVEETTTWERPHGTRIELEMEANMRARRQLHDYIKHTAVVNPHARIELDEPQAEFKYERVTDQLPAETNEIRPHPHGVELGTLIKMATETDSYSVSGFLQSEFTRVGGKTADSIIDIFRDRHFGREMAWSPPPAHEDTDIEAAVEDAVANKGAEATAEFAHQVAARLDDRERVAHHGVVAVVDDVADDTQVEYGTTFGSTVRERATAAAWEAVTATREPDLYALVDGATTRRKDDAVVQAVAERLAAKFDPGERHRLTRDELERYVDRTAEMTEDHDDATLGDTARENITAALWEVAVRVPDDPPKVGAVADSRDTASELLAAMREADIISPPTDCLAPITEDLVAAGLKKEYDAEFYAAATRDASVHGGDPFIVEAGIAYGGDITAEGSADVLRFANRVPLVYQRGACATTDVVKQINWRNYNADQPGGSGVPNGPLVVMVHVASTNVPFTSESKDAVANVPEIEHEIELAIREAARELKSYLNKRQSRQQRRKKQDKLATVLPEMAEKLARVTGQEELDIDATLARIMNDVLVTRERERDTVRLRVENNSQTTADLELTELLTGEPAAADGATVGEMDGEWFLNWHPTVESGETAVLEYELDTDADIDGPPSVDGVDDDKLTVET